MQVIRPWVASTPHCEQSTLVPRLLPYAPWATKVSKDAAHDALDHIQSEDASKTSGSSSDKPQKHAAHTDESTNNPFY